MLKSIQTSMLCTFFTLVFLVGNAVGTSVATLYIDNALNSALPKQLNNSRLNPAIIPGFETEFKVKVPIIGNVKGKAEYDRGTITGFAQVRRNSECSGPYPKSGARFVNCTLGFDHLELTYEGKMKYGKLPKVNIKGASTLSSTIVFIEVVEDAQSGEGHLSNFMITQIGGLEVKFTGLGPFNKYTKFLEPDYKQHAQKDVTFYITVAFRDALDKAIASVPFPY